MFKLFCKPVLAMAMSAAILLLILIKPDASLAAEVIVDPMQPPAYALNKFRLAKLKKGRQTQKSQSQKRVKPKPMLLTSILIGSNRKVAIINDKTLTIGDRIGTAKLIRIQKDKVQLIKNGKRIELRLDKESPIIRKISAESKL